MSFLTPKVAGNVTDSQSTQKLPEERDMDLNPSSTISGFPDSSDGKEFACNVGDPGSIPG